MWNLAIPLVVAAVAKLFGGGDGDDKSNTATTTEEQRALQQEMLQLLGQQRGYMSEQDPLRKAVQMMAMGMMPKRYQVSSDYRSPGANGGASGDRGGWTDDTIGEWMSTHLQQAGRRTNPNPEQNPPIGKARPREDYDEAYRNTVKKYFNQ